MRIKVITNMASISSYKNPWWSKGTYSVVCFGAGFVSRLIKL